MSVQDRGEWIKQVMRIEEEQVSGNADDLWALAERLEALRAEEEIPTSFRRSAIRSQLVPHSGVYLYVVKTQLGWMGVAKSAVGIQALFLPRQTREETIREVSARFPGTIVQDEAPSEIGEQLIEYAMGRCREFTLTLDWTLAGAFQRRVLEATREIPFGETRPYAWVARAIGQPKAYRAVGNALARNPIPIIIPCHRVIASDGSLGGYGGGLALKQKLLQLESARQG